MSRREFPRREVTSVTRVGSYGNVRWEHLLDCGHTEVRARKTSAPKIGCARCAGMPEVGEADLEADARSARVRLADRLGVQLELVEAWPGPEGISATVYLPPHVVERMLA